MVDDEELYKLLARWEDNLDNIQDSTVGKVVKTMLKEHMIEVEYLAETGEVMDPDDMTPKELEEMDLHSVDHIPREAFPHYSKCARCFELTENTVEIEGEEFPYCEEHEPEAKARDWLSAS